MLFVLPYVDVTLIQSSLSVDEASLPTSTGLRRMDGVFQPFVHKFVSGLHCGLDCLITCASALRPARHYHPPVPLLSCLAHTASLQLYRRCFCLTTSVLRGFAIAAWQLPCCIRYPWSYYCFIAAKKPLFCSAIILHWYDNAVLPQLCCIVCIKVYFIY